MPEWARERYAQLAAWATAHEALLEWLLAISVLTFVITLLAIPVLVIRIPTDYFKHHKPPVDSWRARHEAVRITVLVLKNLFGLLIVLTGIALSVPLVPGQGLLTIMIGLMLLDFPGKRRVELRVIRYHRVLNAINWIRARYRRPPLELPGVKSRFDS